jgi:hypothetical protein
MIPRVRLGTISSGLASGSGMTRNHNVFVRWYHVRGDSATSGGDSWSMPLIGCLVKTQAQPSAPLADSCSDGGGVFTNATRKNQPIKSAERGGKGAYITIV